MARFSVTKTWPDGDKVHIVVEADDTYPDAIDQARAVAIRGLKEAIGAVESTRVAFEDEGD